MKTFVAMALAATFAGTCWSPVSGDDIQLKDLPPVVIGTFPAAGAKNVDPALTRLKIAFSKSMSQNSYSLCIQEKDAFPEVDGAPTFAEDGKSCLVKVALKPNKTYIIWINSAKIANFKDLAGHPAVPYLLVFHTADKKFVADKAKAAEAAETWLKLVDDGKFDESWDAAAKFFKKHVPKEGWGQQLTAVRGGLGELVSRKLIFAEAGPKPLSEDDGDGKYLVLRFKAIYDKGGRRIETVTPTLEDGVWKVSGYFVK